jgi:predicted TIM-barrel fold metal-dependent hydrolase
VRLSSQPIEEPDSVDDLLAAWEVVDAQHLVLFSSDYPHWDFDDPYAAVPERMPAPWKERIYRLNARELFADRLRRLEA